MIRGTLSGPGVRRGPGHHHGTSRPTGERPRIPTIDRGIRTDTRGTDADGAVLPANPGGADDLRSTTINYRPAAPDHRPTDETVSAPAMQLYRDGVSNTDSDE